MTNNEFKRILLEDSPVMSKQELEEIIEALGKLTVANSIALRDGRTNGEMSSALKEYEQVEKELYASLVSVNVKSKSI